MKVLENLIKVLHFLYSCKTKYERILTVLATLLVFSCEVFKKEIAKWLTLLYLCNW